LLGKVEPEGTGTLGRTAQQENGKIVCKIFSMETKKADGSSGGPLGWSGGKPIRGIKQKRVQRFFWKNHTFDDRLGWKLTGKGTGRKAVRTS